MRDEILVTGATGNVGRHVVTGLLERGLSVVALARDPSTARLPVEVTIVEGDLSEPARLHGQLDGISRMFLVWPLETADGVGPLLAALGSRLRRVVYLSSTSVRDDLAKQVDPISLAHASAERQIRAAVDEWAFLRSSGMATNTLGWAPEVRSESVVRWVHADAARSLIHERDLAAVAVQALIGDEHVGAVYRLSGPETITQAAQAKAIGAAIGRSVRFEEIAPEQARAALAQALSPEAADAIVDGHAALAREPEPVTGEVERILGRPALSYREWAVDHAEDFR